MKKFFFIALFCISTTFIITTQSKSINDFDLRIKMFFDSISKYDIKGGYEILLKDNPWLTTSSPAVVNGIEIITKHVYDVGKLESYSKISESNIGEKLFKIVYLTCFKSEPSVFVFIIYKPNDSYYFYSFQTYNDIVEELKKINYKELEKHIPIK